MHTRADVSRFQELTCHYEARVLVTVWAPNGLKERKGRHCQTLTERIQLPRSAQPDGFGVSFFSMATQSLKSSVYSQNS